MGIYDLYEEDVVNTPKSSGVDDEERFLSFVDVQKLSKDLKKAAKSLSDAEARYSVDLYYAVQDMRKRAANQESAFEKSGEPHEMTSFFAKQMKRLEDQIKLSLDVYSYNHPVGEWLRGNKGIGPVIAAGLLAHIDIRKAPTVGHIWRYAGLDPTMKWHGRGVLDVIKAARKAEKSEWAALLWLSRAIHTRPSTILANAGLIEKEQILTPEQAQAIVIKHGHTQPLKAVFHADNILAEGIAPEALADVYKEAYSPLMRLNESAWTKIGKSLAKRPWNSELKTLCWKASDSFRKTSGSGTDENPRTPSPYGLLYKDRKAKEVAKNEAGEYAETALGIIASKKIGRDKDAYWWYTGEWTRNPKFNPALETMMQSVRADHPEMTEAGALEVALDSLKPELKPKLPPAHIDARAMRYAVKIFLSHLHEIMYKRILKKNPPLPYPIAHLEHVHKIEPFHFDDDIVDGVTNGYNGAGVPMA